MINPLIILLALACGVFARRIGLPPLIGYLIAGFIAFQLFPDDGEALAPFADAGVLLLLFTIGLRLSLPSLMPRYVWGTAVLHMVIVVPTTALVIVVGGMVYSPMAPDTLWSVGSLAFALSFSSTVFAVKMFEERGETTSFYAGISIGILVIQDIMAVVYLVLATGEYPSVYALLLLALPLSLPVIRRVLSAAGHGELLYLCALLLAFGLAELFEWVSLKSGLGALVAGMLVAVADRQRAKAIYRQFVSFKNLALVAFMLQIGYYGLPSLPMLCIALSLALLVLLRPILYFGLLTLFGLRARTGWLAGLSLFTYSEFGLIVGAAAAASGALAEEWVTTLALAMAFSFVLAAPFNQRAHKLYRENIDALERFQRTTRLPVETIGSLNGATTAVLGMGRIGRGAYAALEEAGVKDIVGIEENFDIAANLTKQGFHCVHGDATDPDFWEQTGLSQCTLILVNLSNYTESLAVINLAEDIGYAHKLVVTTRFPHDYEALLADGHTAYYLFDDVGRHFAQHVLQQSVSKQSV